MHFKAAKVQYGGLKKFAIKIHLWKWRCDASYYKLQTMTGKEILQASFLDLLFENRNKAYGAYALRKFYNQRLLVALLISICIVVLLVLPFSIIQKNKPAVFYDVAPDLNVRTVSITPEYKPSVPTPAPRQRLPKPAAQQQFTQIHITTKPIETDIVPAQSDLDKAVISNQTIEGTAVSAAPVSAAPSAAGSSASLEEPANTPVTMEPQFPGGAAAWAAFLSRNLQALEPLEPGEKLTVLVRFLVDEMGTVTGFEIIKSGGAAFDKEVLRVLQRMPKWKPALRNGQPTAVPFTQPVTFIAAD